jgi:hypothetical protein
MPQSAAAPRALPLALAAALLLALAAAPAHAAWSTDPAANLVIADRTGEQVQTKVVATTDGGCYVSWFDNSTGGYDVYLQRLDAAGDELWAHNGVLVADRGFSSTQDYGLAVDTAGNALLAFRDDSGADVEITASKVDPDGNPLWGTPGIQLTSTTAFVAAPKIAGTSDGDVVVGWTQDSDVIVQKLDPTGSALWGSGVTLARASGNFSLADLRAADAGTAIVSWVRSPGVSPRHLWAQKLAAADGASLWAAGHVQVYDDASGSLQFGNFPEFVSDGTGGAVFAWYTSSPSLQCRAQHVLANGSEAFAHNGVELSTNGAQLRVSPSAAFDTASGDIYAFWIENNTLQSQFGVYGQRLDSSGARQWTASGKVLVPLSSTEIQQVRALSAPGGAIAAWASTTAFDDQPIHAARLDSAGTYVWNPTIVDVKTAATGTSRLAAAVSSLGFAIYAWTDGATDGDIKGQNVNLDGRLGPILFADGFESGDTAAWSATVPPPD